MSIVSIVRCENYEPDGVRQAVAQALRLAELDRLFTPGRTVLLKPNLLSARKPEKAVTTHPEVAVALGEFCRECGCEVAIGDSPSLRGRDPQRYASLCEITGMADAGRRLASPTVRFEEGSAAVTNPVGLYYRSFEVARAVTDADIVVNVPKFKTHGLTTITGAVKNVFGCVPGIRKGLFHVQAAEDRQVFAQMLVDLFGAIRPQVNLMDAVVAMDGEGPNAGRPFPMGLLLASADGVALDATTCAIAGIDPIAVDTTRLAHEQGVGCGNLTSVEVRGEAIESVRTSGFRLSSGRNEWMRIPLPLRRLLRRRLVAVPTVRAAECVGCGDCASACPVSAITPGGPPRIDLDKCIRCYCCHEACDQAAVRLRRGWLCRLILRDRKK